MRRVIILLVLLNGICSNLLAQNRTADSLIQLLTTAKEDTIKVIQLNGLSRAYLFSKPDTSLLLARQALELSRNINYKLGEASSLQRIGSVFNTKGDYPKALEFYLQALKIFEEAHNILGIAGSFSSIADLYFYGGDIKRSLEYSHKTLSMYQQLRDTNRMVNTIINMGDTYEKTNQLDSAMYYTRLGHALAVSKNNTSLFGLGLNNIGNIFQKLGKSDSAMVYYNQATPYLKLTNNDEGLCENYLGLARVFLKKNTPDSCLYYAKLSFTIASNAGFQDKLLASSNFLAGYYRSANEIDSAYAYQAVTIATKDSMFSQQKANQLQSMTYDEAMRQQEIADARLQERTEAKQNALIGGLVALFIVAFLLLRNIRQKRNANTLLQKQKEEIDNKAKELSVQKENLQQSYQNVEQLGEIGRKIIASLSIEKIMGTVYDNVNTLMDAAVFGIGIYNEALKRIDFPSTYENGEPLAFYSNSIDDTNRFGPVCFNSEQEIIIGNLNIDYKDHLQEVPTPHEGGQPISLIFLPLVVNKKKLGVITVQSFRENAYSDYHLFMLRNIATYTAIAIENAASFETLNQTVSTLKATQKQLIQSEKMASLGELTAGIAHEIQNPLNFVNNFSEVNNELIEELKSQKSKLKSEEQDEILNDIFQNNEKINHHGQRAAAIVKGMLQHSRSSSGVKEPTDINALCDEYLRLSYHGLRAKDKSFNATMKTDFDKSIGNINIIPQDIGRVVLNLINNAFYAVDEKKKQNIPGYEPTVTIKTTQNPLSGGRGAVISVSDNGNGIPQKVLDKIFQPFFTTKPTGQGTGLGLSLSYDIVKAHGGEIKVKTLENEGTEFSFMLPA